MVVLNYWDGKEKNIYLTEVEYKELLVSYLAAEKIDSLLVERLRTVAPRE